MLDSTITSYLHADLEAFYRCHRTFFGGSTISTISLASSASGEGRLPCCRISATVHQDIPGRFIKRLAEVLPRRGVGGWGKSYSGPRPSPRIWHADLEVFLLGCHTFFCTQPAAIILLGIICSVRGRSTMLSHKRDGHLMIFIPGRFYKRALTGAPPSRCWWLGKTWQTDSTMVFVLGLLRGHFTPDIRRQERNQPSPKRFLLASSARCAGRLLLLV
jgi:hypothetical protein